MLFCASLFCYGGLLISFQVCSEDSPLKLISLVILLLPLSSVFKILSIHIGYYIGEVQYFRGTLKDFIDYLQDRQILSHTVQMEEWKKRDTA